MPYPIDENFAAGIPAGFAQVGGNGAGFSATHNASAEAADLVFGQNQSFWHMLQADFAADYWFEVDVELVSKVATAWHFGFWEYTNTTTSATGNYEGHRHAYNAYSGTLHSWQRCSWGNGGNEFDNLHGDTFYENWLAAGQRRVLRLEAKRVAVNGAFWWLYRIKVDGVLAMEEWRRYYAQARPAIFGYGCTLRIHGVKGELGSGLDTGAPAIRGDAAEPMLRMRREERTLTGVSKICPDALTRSQDTFGGRGRVTGTVKIKATPNQPAARRVALIDQATFIPVRETWSDPTTGAYEFRQVALNRLWTVMAWDHEGAYRAVIADGLEASLP